MLALFKAGYFLLLLVALHLWAMNWTQLVRAMCRGPEDPKPRIFATWDAPWYLKLTKYGYQHGDPACAFYPLWPHLVRWTSLVIGGRDVLAGMLLSNAVSLAAFLLFFRAVKTRFGEGPAKLALALLLGALFFQFIYTESLFLLLLMTFYLALEQDRFLPALASGLLLPLTRAVGVFCVIPVLVYAVSRSPRPGPAESVAGLRGWVSRFLHLGRRDLLLVAAPLCGWGFYFLLMYLWTGDAFEGFSAQKHWGAQSVSNLVNLPKFIVGFFNPTQWHEFRGSVLDRAVFLLPCYLLPHLRRVDKRLFAWAIVLGVVPAVSGTFTSYVRFAAVAFPLFISMAVLLVKPERRLLRFATLAVFFVLHCALVWRFVNYRWAG
jgi:hypothetical protein